MALTPEQRILRARLAAHARWSKVRDRAAENEKARQAFLSRFEREVDPHNAMDPETRAKAAENARAAYFRRLALRSATIRAARRTAAGGADAA